jgi:hypothetical protein
MKARIIFTFGAEEDEGEDDVISTTDKRIKQKYRTTIVDLPEDLKVGDQLNIFDYTSIVGLTKEEKEHLTQWALTSKVETIKDNGEVKEVKVELCSPEEFL